MRLARASVPSTWGGTDMSKLANATARAGNATQAYNCADLDAPTVIVRREWHLRRRSSSRARRCPPGFLRWAWRPDEVQCDHE